jgi:LCP family protein required for cell wall assembly
MSKTGKKGKLKLAVIIIGAVLLIAVITGGIVFWVLYNRIYTGEIPIVTRDNTYTTPELPTDVIPASDNTDITEPEETTSSEATGVTTPPQTDPIYSVDPINKDIVNVLVIGCDSRNPAADRGRSDTMLIMSYNKKTKEVSIISLLRDSLVPIEGYGWNRLNTAYFFGGAGLCINTVNQIFGLDIQYYITIDFNGFVGVVDELGGVPITLSQAEAEYFNKHNNWGVLAGETELDGKQALSYARNRTTGGSDFARTERQRKVIEALIKKVLREKNIGDIAALLDTGLNYVKTNFSAGILTSLAYNVFTDKISKINSAYVPMSGSFSNAWYKGMLILQIDIEENARFIKDLIYG